MSHPFKGKLKNDVEKSSETIISSSSLTAAIQNLNIQSVSGVTKQQLDSENFDIFIEKRKKGV